MVIRQKNHHQWRNNYHGTIHEKGLNENYFQLGNGNDSTIDSATYVRVTNISSGTAYDVKVRTTANNDGTNVGRTIIAPGESLFSKKTHRVRSCCKWKHLYQYPLENNVRS